MTESFDISATIYDNVFTNSHIGKMQRKLVHDFLKETLPKSQTLDILEINCGTGHDAIWLANRGHRIIATDISSEMVAVARNKENNKNGTLEFKQLDINHLGDTHFDTSFDLIFSDFGGLNCLSPDELESFFKSAEKKLKPNGSIILVIMPKHCLLEKFYFILKGDSKKAFRRNTDQAVIANVDGNKVNTWYYNPKNIIQVSHKLFTTNNIKPIGFCIPPSYLEPFFKNKLGLLKMLKNLDALLGRFSFLSKYSDHYLIALTKK